MILSYQRASGKLWKILGLSDRYPPLENRIERYNFTRKIQRYYLFDWSRTSIKTVLLFFGSRRKFLWYREGPRKCGEYNYSWYEYRSVSIEKSKISIVFKKGGSKNKSGTTKGKKKLEVEEEMHLRIENRNKSCLGMCNYGKKKGEKMKWNERKKKNNNVEHIGERLLRFIFIMSSKRL